MTRCRGFLVVLAWPKLSHRVGCVDEDHQRLRSPPASAAPRVRAACSPTTARHSCDPSQSQTPLDHVRPFMRTNGKRPNHANTPVLVIEPLKPSGWDPLGGLLLCHHSEPNENLRSSGSLVAFLGSMVALKSFASRRLRPSKPDPACGALSAFVGVRNFPHFLRNFPQIVAQFLRWTPEEITQYRGPASARQESPLDARPALSALLLRRLLRTVPSATPPVAELTRAASNSRR